MITIWLKNKGARDEDEEFHLEVVEEEGIVFGLHLL